jgi:hypothetical protein
MLRPYINIQNRWAIPTLQRLILLYFSKFWICSVEEFGTVLSLNCQLGVTSSMSRLLQSNSTRVVMIIRFEIVLSLFVGIMK